MYFDDIEKFPIEKFIKDNLNMYAHKSEDNSRFETLKEAFGTLRRIFI